MYLLMYLCHLVGSFFTRSVENVTFSLITFITFYFHIDSNRIFSVKWFSFTRFFCCFHLRVNGNKSGIFSQIFINILNSYSVCRRLKVEKLLKFVFFPRFYSIFIACFFFNQKNIFLHKTFRLVWFICIFSTKLTYITIYFNVSENQR